MLDAQGRDARPGHPAKTLGTGEVPSLDGLRALSVLIVMVAHSGLGWIVPGGFGVTMFFFISGFIITTLLIREHTKRGDIGLRDFYLRRALRLYPALFAFVAAIVAAHAFSGNAPDVIGIAGGFLYFMNYLVIFAPVHVLPEGNHLWSLAVEAHFYLLYPWLFIRMAPDWRKLAIALAAACLAALAIRIGAASLMASKALVYEYAYQASEARLDSIAYGALCAALLFSAKGAEYARWLMRPAVVAAGLAVLAATLVVRNPFFRDTLRYSLQGLALMPVVASLVLGARTTPAWRILNSNGAILVGWLSYSLYLWHPAAFELGQYITGGRASGFLLGWVLAFVVAWGSYKLIEKPMLRVRKRFGSDRRPGDLAATPAAGIANPAANDNKELPVTSTRSSAIPLASTAPVTPLAHVDGWPIHLANARDSITALTEAALRGEGFSFAPLNLDLLVKLRQDAVFVDAMRKARYVIADGWPIATLGRREDKRIERTTGADLVLPLAEACQRHDMPIYLFGTSPPVLEKVAAELLRRFPNLTIAGKESPPLGFDPRSPIADAAIERIRASGARVTFLALGAPKQEILAARALDHGVKTGFISVGAGLDFIAGAQVRAPSFMRDNGMEWLWRLVTNPRRLAARYAQCALLLAQIAVIEPGLRWLQTTPKA